MKTGKLLKVCGIGSLAVALAWVCCGCRHELRDETGPFSFDVPPPQSEDYWQGEDTAIVPSPPYAPLTDYLLRPGDRIAFTLSVDPKVHGGTYRLMIHDQLTVEYQHEPSSAGDRVRTMRVLPDGSINLPQVGRIEAAGKTVDQVTREANERAKEFYRHPQIVITATEALGLAEELRKTFSSGFTNQSLTLVVSPDGQINLPEIGTVRAFGKTLPQLRDEVNRRYGRAVPGVDVWPHLIERAPDQIFVLGQVRNPGRYLLDRPTHVSQVIAMAGGYNLGSELSDVILIRYREGAPRAWKLNLHVAIWQDLSAGDVILTDDILLADGDVVVLPRDRVQNMNDFVRRVFTEGVYGLIPPFTFVDLDI